MTIVIGTGSVLAYLVSTLWLGKQLTTSLRGRGVTGLVVLALVLHGIVLYQNVLTDEGLDLGFFNAASLMAWVVALLLLITTGARPVFTLGILVWPLAALSVLLTMVFSQQSHAVGTSVGVQTHIVVSILSYGALTIAACQAIVLAIQDRYLRRGTPFRVIDLVPPLQIQESILFQLLALGFFLLSLSLVSGIMFVEDTFAQHLVHKTVLSFMAWLVFGVLLWGRWASGWRGRAAIRWSLTGFGLLLLAYFGAKLVLEIILGRGWTQG